MANRFGDDAAIEYVDASKPEVRQARSDAIESIEAQRLLYPVTVIDGKAVYDGAVSYPAILRAVQAKLESIEQAGSAG